MTGGPGERSYTSAPREALPAGGGAGAAGFVASVALAPLGPDGQR
jgi:hypothetical protein